MSATSPIDVRDMAIVHETFRNAFAESAQLVRANPTPSADRVRFLADHIDFVIGVLHHHHASEDELLYPVLAERAPDQMTMVDQVGHQHVEVNGAIEAVTEACASWRGAPSAETGAALANALDTLNTVLQPHLDDEEQKIVPLAAITLTEQEWEAMGEHARAGIPKNMMPVAFGLLLEPLNDDDKAFMKSHLPAPVRLMFPLLIQRPWNKYSQKLRHGT
ncbi:MAG TPA: hemerythrin domain-containing protein [Actinomycetes bacterium]|nr:hemerythrin domain-containing protein [Actinomycetes bacterium]